jgi:hypothetical protein
VRKKQETRLFLLLLISCSSPVIHLLFAPPAGAGMADPGTRTACRKPVPGTAGLVTIHDVKERTRRAGGHGTDPTV